MGVSEFVTIAAAIVASGITATAGLMLDRRRQERDLDQRLRKLERSVAGLAVEVATVREYLTGDGPRRRRHLYPAEPPDREEEPG